MARPTKQGVDYFPLDVHMDDKFKFVEIKYKLEGFAIIIKLMQRIYSLGYWCKWTEDELLLFSDEIKADPEFVQNVVNECLERGIFNQKLHDNYNILTSKGIQKRYKEIVRRRKDVEVTEEYTLIDGISRVIDDINPSSRQHSDGKSTQSKVNKTKQKVEDKKRYLDHVLLSDLEYERLINEYGKSIVDSKIEDLDNYIGSKGKRYKDHNKTLRAWLKKDAPKKQSDGFQKSPEQIEHEKMLKEMGYFD